MPLLEVVSNDPYAPIPYVVFACIGVVIGLAWVLFSPTMDEHERDEDEAPRIFDGGDE